MGSVAGAPYISSYLADEDILTKTLALAEQGLIDPVNNMEQDNIFIFQGLIDTVVPWGNK